MKTLAEKPTLTPIEKERVAELLPLAKKIASRHGSDDELESVALVSLCEAVVGFRTAKFNGNLESFVRMAIDRDLKDFTKAEARRRQTASLDDLVDAEQLQGLLELPPAEAEKQGLEILRAAILKRFGRRPKLKDLAEWLGMSTNTLARLRHGEIRQGNDSPSRTDPC